MSYLDTSPNRHRAVVRPAHAEVLAGPSITLFAETEAVASNRAVLAAGSPGVPPHFHARSTEIFFVLSGALEALVDEDVVSVGEGDVLTVEPHVVHALAPARDSAAELLVVTTPSIERFDYYRLLDRVQRGEANAAELSASQERFDSYFVNSAVWRDRANPKEA